MRKLSLLVVLSIAATVFGGYQAPLTDIATTQALWNMDATTTLSDGKVIVFDQVAANDRANHHLTMYDGDSGTGYGATLTSSMSGFGNAMKFDGVNDYGRSFKPWTGESDVKIEAWVKADSTGTELDWIAEVPSVYRLWADTAGTRINFLCWDSAGNATAQIRLAMQADTWQHITAGFENGVAYLEVLNGQSGSVNATTNTLKQDYNYTYVGSRGGSDRFFKGEIDDLHISSIPEPATMFLLGLGCLLMRKKA